MMKRLDKFRYNPYISAIALLLWSAGLGAVSLFFARGRYMSEVFFGYFSRPLLLFLNWLPVLLLTALIFFIANRVWIAVGASGVLVLTLLFPIWFIAHGISRLVHLGHIRFVAGRGIYYFTLVINIIGLVLGFLMLFDPLFTPTTIRCFASAYLILLGIDSVVIAVSRMGRRL